MRDGRTSDLPCSFSLRVQLNRNSDLLIAGVHPQNYLYFNAGWRKVRCRDFLIAGLCPAPDSGF